jgi:DNA-binding NarL/FixJ family response regulator
VTLVNRIRVALHTRQPFVARGLAAALRVQPDLCLAACLDSLPATLECLHTIQPDVLVVHLISGISLSDLREIRSAGLHSQIVLWGQDLGGEFAFQAMQLGIRSILPDTTPVEDFLKSLRSVHRGALCFDNDLLESLLSHQRVTLTARQGQIVSLVAQGMKNKEIAYVMGITEGTVKVYLYKLFRKLGMNDRLDMALYGRKNLYGGSPGLERLKDNGASSQGSLLMVARKQAGATVVH